MQRIKCIQYYNTKKFINEKFKLQLYIRVEKYVRYVILHMPISFSDWSMPEYTKISLCLITIYLYQMSSDILLLVFAKYVMQNSRLQLSIFKLLLKSEDNSSLWQN